MSPETAALVEEHLALCPGCDEYLAQMRATLAALGRVLVQTLSRQARDSILLAFRDLPRADTP